MSEVEARKEEAVSGEEAEITPVVHDVEDKIRLLEDQEQSPAVLSQALMSLFAPVVHKIDGHVIAVQESQVNLRQQIERLQQEISKFEALPNISVDLEFYLKKLTNTKRKLNAAQSLIDATLDRVAKLKGQVSKSIKKKQKDVDPPTTVIPLKPSA